MVYSSDDYLMVYPSSDGIWVCLKIVYPYTQWLMTIIPIKRLFVWEYTQFSDIPK
jgi:hypothetical protein